MSSGAVRLAILVSIPGLIASSASGQESVTVDASVPRQRGYRDKLAAGPVLDPRQLQQQ